MHDDVVSQWALVVNIFWALNTLSKHTLSYLITCKEYAVYLRDSHKKIITGPTSFYLCMFWRNKLILVGHKIFQDKF